MSTLQLPGLGGAGAGSLEFDHLGVVVAQLESGRQFLAVAFGVSHWTEEIADPEIGVSVQFGMARAGEPCYELVAPLGEASPIARALGRGRNVLNHVAYRTEDLARSGETLRSLGCVEAAAAQPAVAYGGKLIQFWMTPLRFLVELIEAPEHRHLFHLDGYDAGQSSQTESQAELHSEPTDVD